MTEFGAGPPGPADGARCIHQMDTATPSFCVAIGYDRQGTPHVALEGELDIASTARLRRLLDAALDDRRRMVLDLRLLRFVDLPNVRLLAELSRACDLEVSGATGQVARLLDLLRLRAPAPVAA
jgi:anti-anti-sigma factor